MRKYRNDLLVDLDSELERVERSYILKALEHTNGNKTDAAKILNINFRSLRHRIKKYNLQ
jgi:two-component system response regulator PilR (NtrC family)